MTVPAVPANAAPGSAGTKPRTLFEKVWDTHWVADVDGESLIHIDRTVLYEVTSPQAFDGLLAAGRTLRHPELTFGSTDHAVSTRQGRGDETVNGGTELIRAFRSNARRFGFTHFDVNDRRQGIVHVVAPELGIALPGMTLICGGSHTGTVGALGAWAWGVGTSAIEQALATQVLNVKWPKLMRIRFDNRLRAGVSAKDLVLFLIGRLGAAGATGYAVEICGEAIRDLSMEGRFTVCNMGVEAGARTMMIAPDETTFAYVAGREFGPSGDMLRQAIAQWRQLVTDEGAHFDAELVFDASAIGPQITWGTSPDQVMGIHSAVPDPSSLDTPQAREAARKALAYMDLQPGASLLGLKIDAVFIGSCTNSRLSDLQAAASVVRGRKVAPHVRAMVVPGSGSVKRAAEALGFDQIFQSAGFEWREPGCSMCAAVNEDMLQPGQRSVSTSNRNFEGRQGPSVRTHLASPAMAAAAAIAGAITEIPT